VPPESRAFLAVYPPDDVLDAVEERLRVLVPDERLRRVPRGQWHVTLRFCGRVPDADALVGAVTRACGAQAPIDGVQLVGAGAFPKARHGSVLWLGVGDAAALALGRVAAATEVACVAAGMAPDDRAFHPHVTVGRCSRAHDLRPLVAGLGGGPIGPVWTVGEVLLVASDTRPTGAVHTEVARFPLSG
jgi:2'-5' RNA ligase